MFWPESLKNWQRKKMKKNIQNLQKKVIESKEKGGYDVCQGCGKSEPEVDTDIYHLPTKREDNSSSFSPRAFTLGDQVPNKDDLVVLCEDCREEHENKPNPVSVDSLPKIKLPRFQQLIASYSHWFWALLALGVSAYLFSGMPGINAGWALAILGTVLFLVA